jgi:histidinol-phosphate/aromatic aminotransferase/cobyric acid decarboxylase-like protein
VLVNPNSPTGRYVPTEQLEHLCALASPATRFWIDETYIDYVDSGVSLEHYASDSTNVVVCKSMSKAYALSGVRAAYLCGPRSLIADLARLCPPWAVSLPAQIAACEALKAEDYYQVRWRETSALRTELTQALSELGWRVVPSVTNFVLCELPRHGPAASALIDVCRESGLYLRNASSMADCRDGDRLIRVAVKDRSTSAAMVSIIKRAVVSLTVNSSEMA